jgi:hypothetical protein
LRFDLLVVAYNGVEGVLFGCCCVLHHRLP